MPAPEPGSNWGIFGGLFDPLHRGHLNLAKQATLQAKLDGLIFVPSYNPPHRSSARHTSFDQRVIMLNLALEEYPNFIISEIERSFEQPGYTYDTIIKLKEKSPEVNFSFIAGTDNLNILTEWYKWEELLKEVVFIVGIRPGLGNRLLEKISDEKQNKIMKINYPPIDLSSTEIRKMVKQGTDIKSLSKLLPTKLADYIISEGLYQ